VPEGIAGLAPSKLVADMLASAMEKGGMSKEEVHHGMALTMARSSALVVGEVLSVVEMMNLVDELFACEIPSYTPEGKKIFVVVEDCEVEKLFR
jgi:DNA mismatch repair protein MutL